MTTKNALISVRIPDDLHDRIKSLAAAKSITMSEYVRGLVEERLNTP